MDLNIDIPAELERRIEAEARRHGVSKDAFVRLVLEEKLNAGNNDAPGALPRLLRSDLPIKDRSREYEWLAQHRDEYAGKYVALHGNRLVADGDNYKKVATFARQAGSGCSVTLR